MGMDRKWMLSMEKKRILGDQEDLAEEGLGADLDDALFGEYEVDGEGEVELESDLDSDLDLDLDFDLIFDLIFFFSPIN